MSINRLIVGKLNIINVHDVVEIVFMRFIITWNESLLIKQVNCGTVYCFKRRSISICAYIHKHTERDRDQERMLVFLNIANTHLLLLKQIEPSIFLIA